MKNSQLKTQWPWFDISMSSKVKCYKVQCKLKGHNYMTYYLYFIPTLIIRCTVYELQPVESYVTFILLL